MKKILFFLPLRLVKKIVTNSRGVADEFKAHGFDHVLPLPNGIDLSEFSFTADKHALRKELGLPADKKIALYSGFLYGWKGVDTLVDAAPIIEMSAPDVRLVIVGGSAEDVAAYKRTISERKITNMGFIGYRDRKVIPRYLKAADVLLLPNSARSQESVRYTSPIKLFEYMASGIPIVASDLPSLREILNEGNSVLVPPDDAEGLARGLIGILKDPARAAALSKKARADVEPLTWDDRAKKILKFIVGEAAV
jgi:glycosyltransferase involved in cell wall biosynthesis